MPNTNNNHMQCEHCYKKFPQEGLQRRLPVKVNWAGEAQTVLLCLECRRKEFTVNQKPLPPGVDEYTDPTNGTKILPRITLAEARAEYCVESKNLKFCKFETGLSVQTATSGFGPTKMYEEREIVALARWMYGGDVGIDNARDVFAQMKEDVHEPPKGAVRERRNKIRQAFLEKKVFAAPDLPFVKGYIEDNEGDLKEIVEAYAV
ncbi:hypothetical protein BGZ97_000175 [Linnemannia gamsii]|uniref:Uncharacterized protein n=1 Tax=Linnemannia gamsii TaxID=64522 RepID=A0A9P6R092_9FUNG|nr:hypothetical protein BGZ97_000175 [Linnemannia gamsii]